MGDCALTTGFDRICTPAFFSEKRYRYYSVYINIIIHNPIKVQFLKNLDSAEFL